MPKHERPAASEHLSFLDDALLVGSWFDLLRKVLDAGIPPRSYNASHQWRYYLLHKSQPHCGFQPADFLCFGKLAQSKNQLRHRSTDDWLPLDKEIFCSMCANRLPHAPQEFADKRRPLRLHKRWLYPHEPARYQEFLFAGSVLDLVKLWW